MEAIAIYLYNINEVLFSLKRTNPFSVIRASETRKQQYEFAVPCTRFPTALQHFPLYVKFNVVLCHLQSEVIYYAQLKLQSSEFICKNLNRLRTLTNI